ncbi:LTA synthase family protein [Pasteurella atlantica]|uniref:LTA synthase family protein n=1 Tax=Pasteurellaceae TaxID=712 RepID=UPI002760A0FD|nr:LTA synthase family protein [Pasteurella atlantica]MDP8033722.1 LTA synthase family protein [Pasteurella atlantica]MDP8035657.1 LTA synthase family protein [Pasteurella atlantica]MDP8037662.1 LTA synthase family protein [Pasteurella atlantica]MDP8047957.1 LTA synthase family protein [Pasteurella atlantica]MDP8049912.1 LTA synthase family protein [Pasteurella atlantica]
MLTRETMIAHFLPQEIKNTENNKKAIQRMRVLGARFDIKVVALTLLLPYLYLLIASLFHSTLTANIFSSIIFIVSFIFTAIIIGNYYYFKTYNNYYDVFVFGLVEDDTKAVLQNMYDDYPMIKIILGITISSFIASYFSYFMISYIQSNMEISFLHIMSIILFITICVFLIRGTIHSKPLGRIHAQVSSLSIINKLVPNGIICLNWAVEDRKRDISFEAVDESEGKALIKNALGKETLISKTAKNDYLEEHKPNVVFALMESFGSNILQYDNPQTNDLLGNLRPYFENEIVFKRFLATANGTAPTLAHLYFNSPIQNISQSIVQNIKLKETPFLTYKKKGYKTIFITSGNMMWRNLANYLPLQGVDEMYDQNDLMDTFANARETLSYWGIADEYAFKLAEKLLDESDESLFISILTITNHPPYEPPKHYQAKPVDSNVLKGMFGRDDQERAALLTTYQYAANELGNFITNVKASKKGDNTIISASGDHHMRGIINNDLPAQLFLTYAVPFFISIPKQLKAHFNINYNPLMIGSHKDVMPTLYSLSLSDTEYWATGVNLLATDYLTDKFAYNSEVFADEQGAIDLKSEDFTQYKWNSDNILLLDSTDIEHNKIEKITTYQKLLYWQSNYLVKGYKN